MLRELVTVPDPARDPMVAAYPLKLSVPLTVNAVPVGNALLMP